jgi:protein-S-isoprenylcysteine O-methyltransferase Ste14
MVGLLAFMIDPRWMAWSSVPLPDWLRWTGVGLGVIAGGLLIWALRTLGANLTDTVVTRKKHTLVTGGPYRWVRHPFYDAVGLAILAYALAAANWFLFLTGGTALILMIVRTRTEERHLLARFGDSYRAYAEQTGRFVPRSGATSRGPAGN